MNVGEMQRKLSLWADEDKEHRFFDLYHLIYDMSWLRLAHDYVAQNAGSKTAGCDGITMRLFDKQLEENLQQLSEELKAGTFEPQPVRRVHIRKTDGSGRLRPLGIPAIKDRIVQEALRMVLEPIYEADFSQYSYGFRPNRCTMDAIRAVTQFTKESMKFFWVIEGDIAAYFDTINHRKLTKLLRRRIKDKQILRLVWKFLRAGVMEGKLFRDTKQGTPQGGIVSPLLANIYLHELDRFMQRRTGLSKYEKKKRRKQGVGNYVYVRYADDFVVLTNGTKVQAEECREELCNFLKSELRLNLSKEKTKVTHLNDGFKFLGFRIQRSMGERGMKTKVCIPKEAVDSYMMKIRTATSHQTHRDSVTVKVKALNRITGGWCRYYQYTSRASTTFHRVSHRLFWQMAHWLGRKYRANMPEVMKRFYRDNTIVIGRCQLLRPADFATKTYSERFIKPNPYLLRTRIGREELPQSIQWLGFENRPGMADIKSEALLRDEYICQICAQSVREETSEADHIKPVRRFKRPVDANFLDNIWTLCKECHQWKTQYDRRMESRVP